MSANTATAYRDWAEIARSFERAESLGAEEIEEIRSAIDYLRQKLGKDFFRRIEARWGIRHPAFRLLLGVPSPFAFGRVVRQRLIKWTADLRVLEGCQNLGRVLADLGIVNKCQHAYCLIKAAARLHREGMGILFEPPSPDLNGRKRPDAFVEYALTRERFFVELSCQWLADAQLKPFFRMMSIQETIRTIRPDLRHAGRLWKCLSQIHFEEVLQRIEIASRLAAREERLVEVLDGDALEMVICPPQRLEDLAKWCGERGFPSEEFAGPPDRTDGPRRLGDKIGEKQAQLPPGYPNVLLLENNFLFSRRPAVEGLISELEEEVYKCPHVAAVIVRGQRYTNRDEPPGWLKGVSISSSVA